MKRILLLTGLVAIVSWIGMASQTVAVDDARANASAKPEVVEKSMHEFMEYVFQPTYKRLRASMQAEPVGKNGWKSIKSDSLILAESCNLLLLRAPEEDRGTWNQITVETRQLGGELYHAAAKSDFATATSKYQAMLTKCNACHASFADGKYQLKP